MRAPSQRLSLHNNDTKFHSMKHSLPHRSVRLSFLGALVAALAFAAGCSCSSDPITGPPSKGDGGGGQRDTGPGGDDDASQDANTGDAPPDICEVVDVMAERTIPNVLIVLDRSESMLDDNRWAQAVPAVNNVVTNLESTIAFGLMLFPLPGGENCSTGSVVVTPATGTATAIATALSGTSPGGYTPSALSLDAARTALDGVTGDSYILFVTDGAPNCNAALNKNTCTCTYGNDGCGGPGLGATLCLDDDRTVASVASLATSVIPTYVIGFDATAWSGVLNDMAAAGGTERNTYISVSDGTALEAQLAALAGQVVSCTYELESEPSDYHYVSVTLDDVTVPHTSETNDNSGWTLTGKTIELLGATCETLQATEDADLKITVECEAVVPF